MINIINSHQYNLGIDTIKVQNFVSELFSFYDVSVLNVNLLFESDARVLEINKAYLNHDYYTDIISFAINEVNKPLEAEIIISVDRIKQYSYEHSVIYSHELMRVIIHGCLHFCGYNDTTIEQKQKMSQEEDRWLNLFFKQ